VTVPAFPSTRILIITDAWLPQVNGVVRSIEALVREAPALGVEIEPGRHFILRACRSAGGWFVDLMARRFTDDGVGCSPQREF
jgi:hypothetical protein